MIENIRFENFRVLRKATLPLGRFNLIVGPNGSGKSTALSVFDLFLRGDEQKKYDRVVSKDASGSAVEVSIEWERNSFGSNELLWSLLRWKGPGSDPARHWALDRKSARDVQPLEKEVSKTIERTRVFSLDSARIASPMRLDPVVSLPPNGHGLACVLDYMRDHAPERFNQFNSELRTWLPEFDQILFDVPESGMRSFSCRTKAGHAIPAASLSDGTLVALAILTISWLPDPPPIVAFEEPDRGIHPRLLRAVKDALYRLAYPEACGESRQPVQVIATTHSPYFLDLFKENLDEIVIAEKTRDGATFDRLSERPDIEEILGDSALGEAWFSGVLGGVPVAP